MILDTREQILKSFFYEKYPGLELQTLEVGDSWFPEALMRSEHKVGVDAHDYERLKNELMRLGIWRRDHPEEHHHMFCCDTPKYRIEKKEMKILIGICQRYGIFFHHANSIEQMMAQIEDVRKNWYLPSHAITHLKLPSLLACMLAQIKGVSEDMAVQWAHLLKDNPTNLCAPQGMMLDHLYGITKGGARKKTVVKILDQLEGRA